MRPTGANRKADLEITLRYRNHCAGREEFGRGSMGRKGSHRKRKISSTLKEGAGFREEDLKVFPKCSLQGLQL